MSIINVKTQNKLKELMNRHFNYEEIIDLARDIGIDPDNLEGTVKRAKIQALISHCSRRGSLDNLFEQLVQDRPDVAWPRVSQPTLSEDPGQPNYEAPSLSGKGIRIGELSLLGCLIRDLTIAFSFSIIIGAGFLVYKNRETVLDLFIKPTTTPLPTLAMVNLSPSLTPKPTNTLTFTPTPLSIAPLQPNTLPNDVTPSIIEKTATATSTPTFIATATSTPTLTKTSTPTPSLTPTPSDTVGTIKLIEGRKWHEIDYAPDIGERTFTGPQYLTIVVHLLAPGDDITEVPGNRPFFIGMLLTFPNGTTSFITLTSGCGNYDSYSSPDCRGAYATLFEEVGSYQASLAYRDQEGIWRSGASLSFEIK